VIEIISIELSIVEFEVGSSCVFFHFVFYVFFYIFEEAVFNAKLA